MAIVTVRLRSAVGRQFAVYFISGARPHGGGHRKQPIRARPYTMTFATPLRVQTARTLAELETHRHAWNALAAASPQQLPMASYPWIASYLDNMLPQGSRWASFMAYRGDTLAGTVTVVTSTATRAGMSALALRTPRDDHTQIGDILLHSAQDLAALEALIAQVRTEFPNAAFLEVNRFPENSPLLEALRNTALKLSRAVRIDSYGAYLPVPADFTAYRNGLSKNFKSNLNKATNKVAKLADVRYRFDDGANSAEQDFADFVAAEASGWKGEQGSAISKSPMLTAFYRQLAQRLREAGWLEWQFMYGDGCTLAGNLSIRMPRSVVVWKLGYNDAYSRCSPGSMLMEELIKRESAAGKLADINLTTDLSWYDNWEMPRRTYYTARFYFGLRGRFLWYLPDAAKERLRKVPALVALKARLAGKTQAKGSK
jgi:CelD/BcsL family acetyltransferase involved in cellulose biosynthesis